MSNGNVNRTLAILLSIFFLMSTMCILVSCKDDVVEEKKYNVALMIMRREVKQQPTGERWIVDADTRIVDIEQIYDGKDYIYYIYAYNLPEHPEFHDVWFLYNTKSKIGFKCDSYIQRKKPHNGYHTIDVVYSTVCDRGEYIMKIRPSEESQLWNARELEVRITVK